MEDSVNEKTRLKAGNSTPVACTRPEIVVGVSGEVGEQITRNKTMV